MKRYRLKFSLPGIENSPRVEVEVDAPGEPEAMDAGFDEAFRQFPQYGAFHLEDVEETS